MEFVQQGPSKRPRDIDSFLRHFTTLLTCGSKYVAGAQRVIAVTSSIDPGQKVRTLIVAQNPHPNSHLGPISLHLVQKRHRSLDKVMAGPPSPDLIGHIEDTWAALSAVDLCATDYVKQLASLEIFFLREDTRLCGGKWLAELIGQWKPDRPEITLRKWVNPPEWLVILKGLPKIKSTRMARGQLEWEFFDKTKQGYWEENLQKEMGRLNFWCRYLYYRDYDELAELQPEVGESKGNQVLRYLWTVVAWHAAVNTIPPTNTLCNDKALPKLLKDIEIGLVQVPQSPSSVPTLPEISDEFFIRFPDMIQDRQVVLETLESRYSEKRCHSDNMFFDFVHPEAALMAGQDVGFGDPQRMQWIVQPLAEAGEAVIAVSEECCWCCDWLSKNLEFELVLKKLEGKLWNQLYEAVLESIESFYSSLLYLTDESLSQHLLSL
ncbi:hypothetical protein SCLCIDRAFT_1215887 [Scleroderma citrinum Foug A]|uniref:Uncharacterized protein n=1 Tax=Scleroderma citrinum Foug A TaxID=1036808 RepID=A0A0C3DL81_9AGAM|nr:hypothetical protein SCLCIDRAFT_1215887 [Scleroderma citrinum Foug A]